MIRKILQNIVRGDKKGNLANRFRNKRAKHFLTLLGNDKDKPLNILDVGGTDYFWTTLEQSEAINWKIDLLNLGEVQNQNSHFTYPALFINLKIFAVFLLLRVLSV
ncbi:MAG: hypothetical protein KJ799_06605 [Bacteroidetes bacterium]|nr:hypothetical protein [Bacteroidota bacterium]MBU2506379.1 hypothetical protein [Bacteroidota bacterium]